MNINCPHFEKCSGCQYDIDVGNIPLYAESREFFKKIGIPLPPLHCGNPKGWRTRAKLAVRGTPSLPKIGLFEEGSHRIVDIPNCRVHHPSINAIVEKLKTWILHNNIMPYDETNHQGLLRYIQCSVERKSGRVQLVLVLHAPADVFHKELLEFYKQESGLLHSLWVNVNKRTDNVIFGEEWHLVAGEPFLWEDLCGVSVCFHPACFCQANLDMYEELLLSLRKLVPKNASIVELYAGVGAIGLSLVDVANSICCVEITPEARDCFRRSCERLSEANQAKISLQISSASAEVVLLTKLRPTVLLVDPPRKGLDRSLIAAIDAAPSLEKIVYVSCGWPGFKRDCDALMAQGWRLGDVEPFLFFPGTNHLELLAVFERQA